MVASFGLRETWFWSPAGPSLASVDGVCGAGGGAGGGAQIIYKSLCGSAGPGALVTRGGAPKTTVTHPRHVVVGLHYTFVR